VLPLDDEWQLLRQDENGDVPLYAFRDLPHQLSEYQEMCLFQQSSPESHFTKSWICSRATPEGRVTLANMRLIVTREEKREEIPLSTEDDLRRCLLEYMGVELDASAPLANLVGQVR
jgi:N-hydroxyarylamine O-acetyltransferase